MDISWRCVFIVRRCVSPVFLLVLTCLSARVREGVGDRVPSPPQPAARRTSTCTFLNMCLPTKKRKVTMGSPTQKATASESHCRERPQRQYRGRRRRAEQDVQRGRDARCGGIRHANKRTLPNAMAAAETSKKLRLRKLRGRHP